MRSLQEVILPLPFKHKLYCKRASYVSHSLTHGLLLMILFYFVLLNILECIKIFETSGLGFPSSLHSAAFLTSCGQGPGHFLGLAVTRRAPKTNLHPLGLWGEGLTGLGVVPPWASGTAMALARCLA